MPGPGGGGGGAIPGPGTGPPGGIYAGGGAAGCGAGAGGGGGGGGAAAIFAPQPGQNFKPASILLPQVVQKPMLTSPLFVNLPCNASKNQHLTPLFGIILYV